jgi:signal transduction histidine kinase
MLQGALSNVVKHAGAKRCRVTLRPSGDNRITLLVEDDGRGLASVQDARGGLGLAGIRERASALHGSFEIESALGKGTRLTITLPIATP